MNIKDLISERVCQYNINTRKNRYIFKNKDIISGTPKFKYKYFYNYDFSGEEGTIIYDYPDTISDSIYISRSSMFRDGCSHGYIHTNIRPIGSLPFKDQHSRRVRKFKDLIGTDIYAVVEITSLIDNWY